MRNGFQNYASSFVLVGLLAALGAPATCSAIDIIDSFSRELHALVALQNVRMETTFENKSRVSVEASTCDNTNTAVLRVDGVPVLYIETNRFVIRLPASGATYSGLFAQTPIVVASYDRTCFDTSIRFRGQNRAERTRFLGVDFDVLLKKIETWQKGSSSSNSVRLEDPSRTGRAVELTVNTNESGCSLHATIAESHSVSTYTFALRPLGSPPKDMSPKNYPRAGNLRLPSSYEMCACFGKVWAALAESTSYEKPLERLEQSIPMLLDEYLSDKDSIEPRPE